MGEAKVLMLLLLIGWEKSLSLNWNPIPRKTVRYHEVLDSMARFRALGVWNYTMVTLAEHERVLYVGAREALFALDPNDISRQLRPLVTTHRHTHTHTLWTHTHTPQHGRHQPQLQPQPHRPATRVQSVSYATFLNNSCTDHLCLCVFVCLCVCLCVCPVVNPQNADHFSLNPGSLEDGKGKCPYDPAKGHTGLIVDKELYSATLNNFLGTEPVILRNLGQQHYSMKSEYLPAWLNEPDFVGSALVRESSGSKEGDDDKIYFFFSERAVELDCDTELTVARVARVCKGDLGGTRTLQKKWTTFQKARLVCSLPERHVTFNNLREVFTLPGIDWRTTTFYGIFHAQWGDVDVSAVCQYQIGEVKKVFDGPYKEYREGSQRWGRYTGTVPSPRPGACITSWHRENGYNTSLQLPDATLNFAKKHPLMEEKAQARPLLLTKGINFTRLAVDRVSSLDQRAYNMLFIGTADGWLQRVVIFGSEAHVIEEIQLFDSPQPVDSLTISHTKKYLYIGSRSEVLQLPLANCSRYQSQPDCLLSRDPYCAWDSEGRACVRIDLHRGVQDINILVNTSWLTQIPSLPDNSRLRNVTVVVESDMVLPCQLVSNLAQPSWVLNDRELQLGDEEAGGPRFDQALKALVVPNAMPVHAGRYVCYSEEQGVKFQMERYQVSVVASSPVVMAARAPDGSMGLFWVLVITLGAACLLLLVAALYLRRRLKLVLGKGADMKPLESTLVYPITLPKEPPTFVPSKMPSDEDRFWETGANYYYSDGSLKIVPGHALCPSSQSHHHAPTASPSTIPGQPIHSPSRLSLTNIRGSGSNGYIRLNLSSAGEEREELRRTLQQRSVLPDANPEESSV
ncbi:unnamed protein product [Oncorhynchus mykiss]|uniref:Sema domain-containing protein n=1 Tax=Oncorhynchus mykiss TaxID=8022 RepID=A0A060XK17_ONCMY|nr:unnamed protein product [Oncorhynchus mykiss]